MTGTHNFRIREAVQIEKSRSNRQSSMERELDWHRSDSMPRSSTRSYRGAATDGTRWRVAVSLLATAIGLGMACERESPIKPTEQAEPARTPLAISTQPQNQTIAYG